MKLFSRNAALIAAASLGIAFSVQAQDQFQAITGDTAASPPREVDHSSKLFVVVFAGDTVASVQKRAGRQLNQNEREAIRAARAADHAVARDAIERRGGKVLATYHAALNGIKVSIARDKVQALRQIPGVIDVLPVTTYERMNATSVPLIGAPLAWQLPTHYQGQGIKIGIIDTGIDYTHANFGGPGTVAAYVAAKATDTAPANPALFGPAAPRVKGGFDLVGDNYTGANTPVPDPNPLDCEATSGSVGHGSHVAGTAGGSGVTAAGVGYAGPYNAAIYTPSAFSIGPGVAPQADLYSFRVFGCSGNTNVVAEAIDMAVAAGVNVISMSLGSNWGNVGNTDAGSTAEGAAVANAAAAGIVVVAASGNAGPVPYITSVPAAYDGAISVAATDALAGLPVATLALTGGQTITVQNSNSGAFVNGTTYPIRVLRNSDGTVSLGCNPAEYDPAVTGVSLSGKMVVTLRGTCARVFRAGAAQHFGAAASAMIDTSASSYPPYEGFIPGGAPDPTTGNIYEPVTTPFFGVLATDATKLTGPTGGPAPANATANSAGILANPGFEAIASFSSMGPRIGDDFLKPGITAPGVATVSTASGTGNGSEVLSGTSMATPHVAGVAALVKQANPTWSVADLRAAVLQTASPTLMKDYLTRNEGSGLAQVLPAVTTQAVVRNADSGISFGFADLLTNFSSTKQVTVHNFSPKPVVFNITVTKSSGPASVTVTTPPTVTVNGGSDAQFPVTLAVTATSVGGGQAFQDVGGYIQLTPANSRLNSNVTLTVPYYLVAHSRSNLAATLASGSLNFTNAGGAISTAPSLYIWGLSQPAPQNIQQNDIRAVGARLTGANVIFGVNTHNRTSTTLGFQEIDVCIDTSGAAGFHPNLVLIGINGAALSAAANVQNVYVTALFPSDANCNTTAGGTLLFINAMPTDNSNMQLAVGRGGTGTSGLGLTAANPRFKYQVNYFGTDGNGQTMPGTGTFNAFAPSWTFGVAPTVAIGGTGTATATFNATEGALSPSLGVMVLAPDNTSGASQGITITAP